MFKFIGDIIHARQNARDLADLEDDFNEVCDKLERIVAHATDCALKGWHTADEVVAEIYANRTRLWDEAREVERKVLASDPLVSMHELERKVLVSLHDEACSRLADIAKWTGIAVNDVRTIVKGFVIKGLAYFGPATDDEGRPSGSGYVLTDKGAALKARALPNEIAESADLAA